MTDRLRSDPNAELVQVVQQLMLEFYLPALKQEVFQYIDNVLPAIVNAEIGPRLSEYITDDVLQDARHHAHALIDAKLGL